MTRRKALYAFVIGLIVIIAVIYFVFLMPREHIYNATLASNPMTVYRMSEMFFLHS